MHKKQILLDAGSCIEDIIQDFIATSPLNTM